MNDNLINGGSGICPRCGERVYSNLVLHTQLCSGLDVAIGNPNSVELSDLLRTKNQKMKIIYISSPYTKGDVADNTAVQMNAAHTIMDLGQCPVAPLLSHFLHIHRARPYQDWLAIDLAIIPKMDAVLRLPGESSGADQEVMVAEALGIPVCYGWEELDNWLTWGELTK